MWPGAEAHRGQRTGHASKGSPGTWEAPTSLLQEPAGTGRTPPRPWRERSTPRSEKESRAETGARGKTEARAGR